MTGINMTLHQEADEIAYRCAAACERPGFILSYSGNEIDVGTTFTKVELDLAIKRDFDQLIKRVSRRLVNKSIDINLVISDLNNVVNKIGKREVEIVSYKQVEKPYIAEYTLHQYIKSLYRVMVKDKKVVDVKLHLSPSNKSNFRYKVVNTIGPHGMGYKAGRGDKPHYHSMMREIMISEYKAEEIEGYEADDALGIHSGKYSILSHIDKDINMVYGWHYDHVEKRVYFVPDGFGYLNLVATKGNNSKIIGAGDIFFYYQLLTGDSIDNIPGIPKCGPLTAYNLLRDCTTEKHAFTIILQKYEKYYEEDAILTLKEMADLLWIVRSDYLTGSQVLEKRGLLK